MNRLVECSPCNVSFFSWFFSIFFPSPCSSILFILLAQMRSRVRPSRKSQVSIPYMRDPQGPGLSPGQKPQTIGIESSMSTPLPNCFLPDSTPSLSSPSRPYPLILSYHTSHSHSLHHHLCAVDSVIFPHSEVDASAAWSLPLSATHLQFTIYTHVGNPRPPPPSSRLALVCDASVQYLLACASRVASLALRGSVRIDLAGGRRWRSRSPLAARAGNIQHSGARGPNWACSRIPCVGPPKPSKTRLNCVGIPRYQRKPTFFRIQKWITLVIRKGPKAEG
ncbi:unnamed protein product [Nesidiocoris tenuis]|uniref:Uncharacterized protein n=1 Tax=Nesidiocoris tenuis TaxID=355587 RepID=A0A6H5GXF8_9HEMI|nr:unnamed protein product [Nesidiocoris tenuis]